MNDLFMVFLFLSFVGLVVGLIRPQLFHTSRKMAGIAFGGMMVFFFIALAVVTPSPQSPTIADTASTVPEAVNSSNTTPKPDTGANSATQAQTPVAQTAPVQKTTPKPAPTPAPTQQPAPAPITSVETISQKNAVRKAIAYLGYSAYSRDGLIAQMEYEQFSHVDAVYGADNSGTNWNEQAAKKAKQYMAYSAYSRGGLIEQLVYEKFTQAQAEYGANAVGL